MIEVLALFTLVVIIRIIPKFINTKISSDTWYHISCADNIRKNKHKVPEKLEGYLLPSGYNYPFLYHFVLSFIPTQKIIKYERVFSAVIDGIMIVISYYMFSQILNDKDIALNLSILLTLSPTFLKVSTGPRAFDLTPRVFGELTTLLYFLAMYQFYLTNDFAFYFISITFGSISFLSSKFSVQVILIFSILMSVFIGSIEILLSPILSFIFAIIISDGKCMTLIKQQCTHLYKYATELKNIDGFIGQINSIQQYKEFVKSCVSFNLIKAYKILQLKLIYLNFFYKDFEYFILLVLFVQSSFFLVEGPLFIDIYVTAWLSSGIFTFIITGTNALKFIGEADRYLEFAVFPLYVTLSVFLNENFIIIFTLFLLLFLYNLFVFCKSKSFNLNDLYSATDFIRSNYNAENNNLLGLVSHSSFYQGKLLTGLDTMVSSASEFSKTNWKNNLWDKYYKPAFPVRTNDFEWMQQEFGVNIILAYQPYIESVMQSHNHVYNFGEYIESYNKNNFVVYVKI